MVLSVLRVNEERGQHVVWAWRTSVSALRARCFFTFTCIHLFISYASILFRITVGSSTLLTVNKVRKCPKQASTSSQGCIHAQDKQPFTPTLTPFVNWEGVKLTHSSLCMFSTVGGNLEFLIPWTNFKNLYSGHFRQLFVQQPDYFLSTIYFLLFSFWKYSWQI